MSSTNSSLRPAWHRGNQSGGGGRGFQPPPQVASERSSSGGIASTSANQSSTSTTSGNSGALTIATTKSSSSSTTSSNHNHQQTYSSITGSGVGGQNRHPNPSTDYHHHGNNSKQHQNHLSSAASSNKYAALDDDDDVVGISDNNNSNNITSKIGGINGSSTGGGGSDNSNYTNPSATNSRSEGLRGANNINIGLGNYNANSATVSTARSSSSSTAGAGTSGAGGRARTLADFEREKSGGAGGGRVVGNPTGGSSGGGSGRFTSLSRTGPGDHNRAVSEGSTGGGGGGGGSRPPAIPYVTGTSSSTGTTTGTETTATATSTVANSNDIAATSCIPLIKVIRYTRERLLSMRPPNPADSGPPQDLVEQLEDFGPAIISDHPQDPVCWDTFDAEEIWAMAAPPATSSSRTGGGRIGSAGTATIGGSNSKGGSDFSNGGGSIPSGTGIPSEDAAAAAARSGSRGTPAGGALRNNRENTNNSGGGRWQRGVALPPPDAAGGASSKKSGRESRDNADDPSDLWDDPVGSTEGAALDFSAFGSILSDNFNSNSNNTGLMSKNKSSPIDSAYDFEKIAEATKRFEAELHRGLSQSASSSGVDDVTATSSGVELSDENAVDVDVDDGTAHIIIKVDPKRPLATDGTTIRSGSGDNVNVFEDFDDPDAIESMGSSSGGVVAVDESKGPHPIIRAANEDPDASSRLMALIGVKKEELNDSTILASSLLTGRASIMAPALTVHIPNATEPVIVPTIITPPPAPIDQALSAWGIPDAVMQHTGKSKENGTVLGIPVNPWGDPMLTVPSTSESQLHGGLDLKARLREAELEQKARDEEVRRRQAQEDSQRLALAQQQNEARQASIQQQQQQQQQQAGVQVQVENVLMERVSTILENSWGRSDLISILATLHSEDSRVIPLLSNVDALRALLIRNPQRVALRHDPGLRAEMAALLMTNAQWQQQQQLQAAQAVQQRLRQQEELQRREQQRRLEFQQQQQAEAAQAQAAVAAARAQQQLQQQQQQQQQQVSIILDAPWYYSDPQKNIQGPFRGDEMRQWLEAGYFKGDLPISQQPIGPFRPLSMIFPDLSVAFVPSKNAAAEEAAGKAKAAEERALMAQAEAAAAEHEREVRDRHAKELAAERERRAREAVTERQRMINEAADRQRESRDSAVDKDKFVVEIENNQSASSTSNNGGNESSAHLKMLLGLSSQFATVDNTKGATVVTTSDFPNKVPQHFGGTTTEKAAAPKSCSNTNAVQQAPMVVESSTPSAVPPSPSNAGAPAWGGAAIVKPAQKKSMSEIQMEEARAAAMRQEVKRSSASGWANVAASRGGSNAWAGGMAQQKPAVVISKPVGGGLPATAAATLRPNAPQPRATSLASVNVPPPAQAQIQQQPMQRSQSLSGSNGDAPNSATATTDAFGAKMSPLLEKWCKDQMQKLNGTDDLTLVSFCMTLTDPIEIRGYLTAYLGSTPQVNTFASEFINRKGGTKDKTDEWESTVTVKKGRKKKAAGGK